MDLRAFVTIICQVYTVLIYPLPVGAKALDTPMIQKSSYNENS